MKNLTARDWQEITDRWTFPARTVTLAQLARHYGVSRERIRKGLLERGLDPATADHRILCGCGCGVRVGRIPATVTYEGQPLFRNAACWRRWKASQPVAPLTERWAQQGKTLVRRTVSEYVRKGWPSTWCIDCVGETLRIYRTPQDRSRARLTGTLIVPLLVIHTTERIT